VSARFEINADETVLYVEDDFPVVEFAAELTDWVRSDFESGKDFEFDSMSTAETGWVWIRRNASGWRVGSLHQDRADPVVRSDLEIRTAAAAFIESLKGSAAKQFGTDLTPYVEGSAP
jgi:hypothetical protein